MKFETENGRSMVEMLGTLAIIGVLSIGGIAGYNYGINKHRANTIIKDVMLRATDAIAQYDTTGDANLSNWPTITADKYTIGLEEETIGIQVDGLPKELCKMVYEGIHSQADVKFNATILDPENDDINCGDINSMVFYVNDTINIQRGEHAPEATECTTKEDCSKQGVCMGCIIEDGQEKGYCEYACQELEYLESDGGQYIDTGYYPCWDSHLKIDFYLTKNFVDQSIYASVEEKTENGWNNSYFITSYKGTHSGWVSFGKQSGNAALLNILPINTMFHFEASKNGIYSNGNFVDSTKEPLSYRNQHSLYLFARNYQNTVELPAYVRIYSFSAEEMGEKKIHLIPVLDPEGVPAMLDQVEEKLYYNQGSGQFKYGK